MEHIPRPVNNENNSMNSFTKTFLEVRQLDRTAAPLLSLIGRAASHGVR